MSRVKKKIEKESLRDLYVHKNLSPAKIGLMFDCTWGTVRNRLKEFGIAFKEPAIARQRYPRKSFYGGDIVKAYMIGFRMGDLNVYRPRGRSRTIVVRCHTTQSDQVEVMESLFKDFGRCAVSFNRGHYHVNCFLDESFLFLVPKDESAWKWVKEGDDRIVLAFIAGYVDAEANFILNQGRARFKIDSYDDSILEWMSEWFSSKGINNSYRIIYQVGDLWNGAFPINKNLWRLNVNDMRSMKRLIDALIPYIRHKKRMHDMVICQSNVEGRLLRKKHNEPR